MNGIAFAAIRGRIQTAGKIRQPAWQERGWLFRVMAALHETRKLQAKQEIRKYGYVMPQTTDEAG